LAVSLVDCAAFLTALRDDFTAFLAVVPAVPEPAAFLMGGVVTTEYYPAEWAR
jgi:hypothetical protein